MGQAIQTEYAAGELLDQVNQVVERSQIFQTKPSFIFLT